MVYVNVFKLYLIITIYINNIRCLSTTTNNFIKTNKKSCGLIVLYIITKRIYMRSVYYNTKK